MQTIVGILFFIYWINIVKTLIYIPEHDSAKFIKLYPRGFAEYTYPQFHNSQEFEWVGGIIFEILVNSNESHVERVLISAL